MRLVPNAPSSHGAIGSTVTVTLADERRFERHEDSGFLELGDLADKFTRLTRAVLGQPADAALYERLQRLEAEPRLDWLGAATLD